MNPIYDEMPELPPCPHCGHDGEGLNWAFPDPFGNGGVQVACLACGVHGPAVGGYSEAIAVFQAGQIEKAA